MITTRPLSKRFITQKGHLQEHAVHNSAAYLEEQAIDHDQVPNSQLALGNTISSQHHGGCKSPAEDDILP